MALALSSTSQIGESSFCTSTQCIGIYIAFDRDEEHIELDAKVVIGVERGRITDIEVLLDRERVEKLRKLLRP